MHVSSFQHVCYRQRLLSSIARQLVIRRQLSKCKNNLFIMCSRLVIGGKLTIFTTGSFLTFMQEEMKKSNEAMVLPDAFNFQNQELVIPNTCNSHADPNTLYFPSNRTFERKEVPSFHEVQVKSDSARKASEVLKNEKQYATRMTTVSFPVKFGENSRKRQRTNDGVKSALQRKMEHLDKEKERR